MPSGGCYLPLRRGELAADQGQGGHAEADGQAAETVTAADAAEAGAAWSRLAATQQSPAGHSPPAHIRGALAHDATAGRFGEVSLLYGQWVGTLEDLYVETLGLPRGGKQHRGRAAPGELVVGPPPKPILRSPASDNVAQWWCTTARLAELVHRQRRRRAEPGARTNAGGGIGSSNALLVGRAAAVPSGAPLQLDAIPLRAWRTALGGFANLLDEEVERLAGAARANADVAERTAAAAAVAGYRDWVLDMATRQPGILHKLCRGKNLGTTESLVLGGGRNTTKKDKKKIKRDTAPDFEKGTTH